MHSEHSNAFKNISTPIDLVRYLNDSNERLKSSKYIYHYTTLSNAIKILKGKKWHLANPKNMNDRLEYENGDKSKWHNIFFSSFMTEDKESIGMWSMYAQPWEMGVKISIPSTTARKWVGNVSRFYEVNEHYVSTNCFVDLEDGQLKLSSVAYCTTDKQTKKDMTEMLRWSNVTNTLLKDVSQKSELTGYIKDMAWSYEKEIRIRAEFDNDLSFNRVAIDIPDYVIDSMTITASPLFEGNLAKEIEKEVHYQIQVEKSLFEGRLNIKTICQSCKFKI